jgi:hypothetical protein
MLPTPETVPFRLTRDLVDGMGVSGVEGVFRRCCQKTMEVMRTSQEALLTIVQVRTLSLCFNSNVQTGCRLTEQKLFQGYMASFSPG